MSVMPSITFTIVCVSLLILNSSQSNNTWNCPGDGTCGWATNYCNPNEDCLIICSGYHSCASAIFICPSGPYNCNVDLIGMWSAESATFNAFQLQGGTLKMNITHPMEPLSSSSKVFCPKNGICDIYINGGGAPYVTINATQSTSLSINIDSGSNSLDQSAIYCPDNGHTSSKNCHITSYGTNTNPIWNQAQIYAAEGVNDLQLTCISGNCGSATLFCGDNSQYSCTLTDSNSCNGVCNTWVYPTISPTYMPSNFPSKFPTKSPTNIPSDSPSKFPSKYPTNMPTKIPSQNPTQLPSINPTMEKRVDNTYSIDKDEGNISDAGDTTNVIVFSEENPWIFVILVVLILCILGLVYYHYRKQSKLENKIKTLETEMKKKDTFMAINTQSPVSIDAEIIGTFDIDTNVIGNPVFIPVHSYVNSYENVTVNDNEMGEGTLPAVPIPNDVTNTPNGDLYGSDSNEKVVTVKGDGVKNTNDNDMEIEELYVNKQTKKCNENDGSDNEELYINCDTNGGITVISLEEAKGLNVDNKEAYLSDVEFESVFKMTKEQFYVLKVWKQKQLKKKYALF